METQKQKTDKEKVEKVFVKLSEMQADDKNALPKFRANLLKTKSKRGQVYYRLSIELHELLKIDKTLQEKEFTLIVLERKLRMDLGIQGLAVAIRLIKGKTNTGRDWYRYEVFVSKSFTLTGFLDDTDIALMQAGNIKLSWVDSPEKIDDDMINVFSKEDFE